MAVDWFPLWLSLKVALIATALSLVIGLWLAYLLAHRRFRGMEILDAATALPLVLPPTVLGGQTSCGRVWGRRSVLRSPVF